MTKTIYCLLVPEFSYNEYESYPAKILKCFTNKEKAKMYLKEHEDNEFGLSIEEVDLEDD